MLAKHVWLRRTLSTVLAAVLSLAASSSLRGQTTSTPDTAAGRTLRAFLDAFNSDDLPTLQAYVKEYGSPESAEGLQGFGGQTGGFTLLSIKTSNPDSITFMVEGKSDHRTAFGNPRLANVDPPKVKSLNIPAIPPGATVDQISLTPQTRDATIRAISERLSDFYVYPEVAKQMISAIQDHQKGGSYNAITDGDEFASALMQDLRAVSHDKHLFVGYVPYTMPDHGKDDGPRPTSAAGRAQFREEMEHDNCAFNKIEILPGDIGYSSSGSSEIVKFVGP